MDQAGVTKVLADALHLLGTLARQHEEREVATTYEELDEIRLNQPQLPYGDVKATAIRLKQALEQGFGPVPSTAADDLVSVPRHVAEIVDKVFLPRNPNKLRGSDPVTVEAAHVFRAAVRGGGS